MPETATATAGRTISNEAVEWRKVVYLAEDGSCQGRGSCRRTERQVVCLQEITL